MWRDLERNLMQQYYNGKMTSPGEWRRCVIIIVVNLMIAPASSVPNGSTEVMMAEVLVVVGGAIYV